MATAYDIVRYPSSAFPHTHPASLGAQAALVGKRFTPLERARVLEIGCGEGVNLLSMAIGAPKTEFVGVDLAEAPIEVAKATTKACGVANASFHVGDILKLDDRYGRFDYIIAHGVYAWVPADVRAALMRLFGELLADNGLAMVSYNALPGARLREALRDMLLYVSAGVDDPAEKLGRARAMLSAYVERWSKTDSLQHALGVEAGRILKRAPEGLFHDELGAVYAPQTLSDVVKAARGVGLDYLTDASPDLESQPFFPNDTHAAERADAEGDWVRYEQLIDFRQMRPFRNTVLCRGGDADRRMEPSRLRGLFASGPLEAIGPGKDPDTFEFRTGGAVEVSSGHAKLIEFLKRVAAASPGGVALDEIADDAYLAEQIFRAYAARIVHVRTAPQPLTISPGEKPIASPLARYQSTQGATVVTALNLGSVKLEDPGARAFLERLDGMRTRAELAREMSALAGEPPEEGPAKVDGALVSLSRLGVMLG